MYYIIINQLIKKIKILLYFIPLLIFAINIPFILNYKRVIFPIKKAEFFTYHFDDSANKGNSKVVDFKLLKNQLIYSFILNKGFHNPYTGYGLSYKSPYGIDISKYKYIKIKMKSENSKKIKCELRFYEEGVTDINNGITYRYYVKEIPISSEIKIYKHDIYEFITPDWWYGDNKLTPDSGIISKNIKKNFYGLNLVNNQDLLKTNKDTITVEYIAFEKNIFTPLIISIILILIIYSYIVLFKWFQNMKSVSIYHKKLNIENYKDINEEKVFKYIFDNFNNPEISISSINKATGIYEKKITKTIQLKTSGLSFKQYLNHVRLDEAKRLLRETDSNITEIAFHVGYNSSSHFSRIFKQFFKLAPKDYRNMIK